MNYYESPPFRQTWEAHQNMRRTQSKTRKSTWTAQKKPKEANAAFRLQSISSRRSTTFWTSKSENEVLEPDNTIPKAMGYFTGTCLTRFHSELRITADAIVAQVYNTGKEQKEENARLQKDPFCSFWNVKRIANHVIDWVLRTFDKRGWRDRPTSLRFNDASSIFWSTCV